MVFRYSNHNNMLSTSRQENNEESNFLSRNYGYGQTLVLYHSKLFINLDGSTITEDSFNNKGNGNQDFSSAHINTIPSPIRTKQTHPYPSPPAPAIHTDTSIQYHALSNGDTSIQYHALSNGGMEKRIRCARCKTNYPCPPGKNEVHCPLCDIISYGY